jgi:hypothetical protein
MRTPWLLLVAVIGWALLGGCKSKAPGNTAEAVTQAFVDAMAKGDTQGAAELWDYVAEARKGNQDWDDIPSGQRGQIIGKLKASKAEELAQQASAFGPGMKAGLASASGEAVTVTAEGGPQGAVAIYLTRTDGKWGVGGFQVGAGG